MRQHKRFCGFAVAVGGAFHGVCGQGPRGADEPQHGGLVAHVFSESGEDGANERELSCRVVDRLERFQLIGAGERRRRGQRYVVTLKVWDEVSCLVTAATG